MGCFDHQSYAVLHSEKVWSLRVCSPQLSVPDFSWINWLNFKIDLFSSSAGGHILWFQFLKQTKVYVGGILNFQVQSVKQGLWWMNKRCPNAVLLNRNPWKVPTPPQTTIRKNGGPFWMIKLPWHKKTWWNSKKNKSKMVVIPPWIRNPYNGNINPYPWGVTTIPRLRTCRESHFTNPYASTSLRTRNTEGST